MNTLYYGDNLDVLCRHIADESVDLIYLDPPFKSNQNYNVLFQEQNGSRSAAQIKAFEDTWSWDQAAAMAYQEIVEAGGDISRTMQAFRTLLGENDMLAYLSMMAPRLIELHRVLAPTGSIYLHCDPTASAHLRLLMNAVFGAQEFRNEIIWYYKTGGMSNRWFGRKHDVLLFYSKTSSYKFFPQKVKSYLMHKYGFSNIEILEENGQYYTMVGMRDVWDIPALRGNQPEMLGYPTQKPETLLERIVKASSNKGDTILDPFCGCGTAIAVAQRLGRQWIGIDVTHLAITLIKHRLQGAFGTRVEYEVMGEPVDVASAKVLAKHDPWQFQLWALGLVNARPVKLKKGADKGIDGRLYFHDERESGKTKQVIFSVKAGNTGPAHVRDLRGVVEREKAAIGVLITMREPTNPMRREVASAGFYESGWGAGATTKHLKLQLLTVGELLSGKMVDMPPAQDVRTFKKAPKANKGPQDQQEELF